MQVSNEHTEPMISFGEPLHVSVERGIKLFNSIQRSYSNPLPIDDDDDEEEAITGDNNASNQNSATIVAPFYKLGKAAMHGFGIGHLFTNKDMSQPAPAAATTAADIEMDGKTMMAEIRQKLAKYDQLEQEISKLTQEQATLESYVTNLIRASKPVNYFEQTFDVSDESDFEQSSPSAKTPAKKRGRQAKASSGSAEPKAAPASKKAKHVDSSDDDSEDDLEPQRRKEREETEAISSSPASCSTKATDEEDRSPPPSTRAEPAAAKRGTRKVEDDSDSDEEFDQDSESESDYGGKGGAGRGKKAAEASKPKPAAAVAKSTASRAKKTGAPTAKKTATATPALVKKNAPAIVRPTLKKSSSSQLGSLLKSPPRPTSPKVARPSLTSGGSSGTLSLQVSPVSVRKIGVRGGLGASSLKSLLGGSSVPHAGLSRRVLPKK